jgi:hypothetical protein
MKKQLLVLSIALLGYHGTSRPMLALAIAAKKSQSKVPKVVAPKQTKEVKVKKGRKLVSKEPSIVSVHKDKEGKTHIKAHKPGVTFLHEIEEGVTGIFDDIGEFFTGVKNGVKSKKKKGHKIEVAQHAMPASMKEGNKVHVAIKKGHKYEHINKNDDDAGDIKTKHIKLDDTHSALCLHATDSGKNPVHVKNKETDKVHNIMIHDKNKK